MEPIQQIRSIIVGEFGLDPLMEFEYAGFYLTLNDYMYAVAERGGHALILQRLRMFQGNRFALLSYIHAAITVIIVQYLANNPDYVKYYTGKIKKAS